MSYSFSKGRYTNNDRLRKYNFDANDADGTDKKNMYQVFNPRHSRYSRQKIRVYLF